MQDPLIEDRQPESLWFLVERNPAGKEDTAWIECCKVQCTTADVKAEARKVLDTHASRLNSWCRVKAFRDIACTGDPILVLRNPLPVGPPFDDPEAVLSAVPEAELPLVEEATVLPFPGGQPESFAGAPATDWSRLKRVDEPTGTPGEEVTKDKPADDAARVHVTLEGPAAEEIQNMVHTIVGLSTTNRRSKAEELVIAWGQKLHEAPGALQKYVNEEGAQVPWYNTDIGLEAMALAASGFLYHYQTWKLLEK